MNLSRLVVIAPPVPSPWDWLMVFQTGQTSGMPISFRSRGDRSKELPAFWHVALRHSRGCIPPPGHRPAARHAVLHTPIATTTAGVRIFGEARCLIPMPHWQAMGLVLGVLAAGMAETSNQSLVFVCPLFFAPAELLSFVLGEANDLQIT